MTSISMMRKNESPMIPKSYPIFLFALFRNSMTIFDTANKEMWYIYVLHLLLPCKRYSWALLHLPQIPAIIDGWYLLLSVVPESALPNFTCSSIFSSVQKFSAEKHIHSCRVIMILVLQFELCIQFYSMLMRKAYMQTCKNMHKVAHEPFVNYAIFIRFIRTFLFSHHK